MTLLDLNSDLDRAMKYPYPLSIFVYVVTGDVTPQSLKSFERRAYILRICLYNSLDPVPITGHTDLTLSP